MPQVKATKKGKNGTQERKVMYPVRSAELRIGDEALTVEEAKDLLGWKTEAEIVAVACEGKSEKDAEKARIKTEFGDDYLLKDEDGQKIRCLNNTHNRPFTESWSRTLAQDILRRHWEDNGESIIIGKTGLVLSGQHRLVGLVLAEQIRTGANKALWEVYWRDACTLETTVSFGVSESDKVTRTLDNVRPRSLADVLFCDPTFFGAGYDTLQRSRLARATQFCIGRLWTRTGVYKEVIKFKTHSESLDFLTRHPRIVDAVKVVYALNMPKKAEKLERDEGESKEAFAARKSAQGGKNTTKLEKPLGLSLGDCAAFLYLMAACDTNPDDGYTEKKKEKDGKKDVVNFDQWETAVQFWTLLAGKDASMQKVFDALHALPGENAEVRTSTDEIINTLILAWHVFKEGEAIKDSDLKLEKPEYKDEVQLITWPECEGIDVGSPKAEVALKWWKEVVKARAAANGNGGIKTETPPVDDESEEEEDEVDESEEDTNDEDEEEEDE